MNNTRHIRIAYFSKSRGSDKKGYLSYTCYLKQDGVTTTPCRKKAGIWGIEYACLIAVNKRRAIGDPNVQVNIVI
jgi:hypothetical protein